MEILSLFEQLGRASYSEEIEVGTSVGRKYKGLERIVYPSLKWYIMVTNESDRYGCFLWLFPSFSSSSPPTKSTSPCTTGLIQRTVLSAGGLCHDRVCLSPGNGVSQNHTTTQGDLRRRRNNQSTSSPYLDVQSVPPDRSGEYLPIRFRRDGGCQQRCQFQLSRHLSF